MAKPLNYLKETPSQTAGPYVHLGLAAGAAGLTQAPAELGTDIAGPKAQGERIRIEGIVRDGTGAPVRDALIEVWQANAQGRYAHPEGGGPVEPGFRGWGRAPCDFETGHWAVDTVKPGPVPWRGGMRQAPHLSLWIVARGINIGLSTRMYFGDEDAANAADPILGMIEQAQRRATLIAPREDGSPPTYHFDIALQGADETVFFDF